MTDQQEREMFKDMPNPLQTDLDDPLFESIWQTIKSWDVNVPAHYAGYCGANGSHVMLILSQLRAALAANVPAGWKLVPVKPTTQMLCAAENAYNACKKTLGGYVLAERRAYEALLAAAPPAPAQADWTKPTAYRERFAQAVALLCGKRAPDDMTDGWLDPGADDYRLQAFAANHGPAWAQGIVLLDAAHVLADTPVELRSNQ